MPTKTPTKDTTCQSSTTEIGAAEIFPLLAHTRRRYTLHYLSQRVGAVSLSDLAEQIALWEDDPTSDRYKRILTDLYHNHLPKLAEYDLVTYDLDREEVKLLERVNSVTPYLNLAVRDDLR